MNTPLLDIARTAPPPAAIALDWVGMHDIALPLIFALDDTLPAGTVATRADIEINLPDPAVKGIHMSRLYTRLAQLVDGGSVSPATLTALLAQMIDSHRDCGSNQARLVLRFAVLIKRPALQSEGLAGWKSYPVTLVAEQTRQGPTCISMAVTVTYSSTCPCSAALSRQLLQAAFNADFASAGAIAPGEVAHWLGSNASLATPHSQRSLATVSVPLLADAGCLPLHALIRDIENALGTPVQTAVKRADEQAFARLNGSNLMYVEDAARKIRGALVGRHEPLQITVRHLESLHPHDAVASLGTAGGHPLPVGN